MIGITEDHEFKTRDGWKFFHEIDIKKDELYCWRFKEIDDDPCGLWYCDSYEQNGNQITNSANFYISPDKKCFYSKNDCDLFQIKNDYILKRSKPIKSSGFSLEESMGLQRCLNVKII